MQMLLETEDIGDIDLGLVPAGRLAEVARERATELDGAELFIKFATHPQSDLASPAAAAVVRNADVLAMMEMASWLGRGGEVQPTARQFLGRVFLERSGDRGADYGTRSQALKAAMVMAQSDQGLYRRLQGELIDVDAKDDGDYLRHVAAVAGAVLAREPEDALREALERLVGVPEAEDEAAMELGLDALRSGLDAVGRDDAVEAFRRALDWFAAGRENPRGADRRHNSTGAAWTCFLRSSPGGMPETCVHGSMPSRVPCSPMPPS